MPKSKTAVSKTRLLCAWPRGMGAEVAAAYIGISKSAFYNLCRRKDFPVPIQPTPRRNVWLKDQIDAWLDVLAGASIDPDPLSTRFDELERLEALRKR